MARLALDQPAGYPLPVRLRLAARSRAERPELSPPNACTFRLGLAQAHGWHSVGALARSGARRQVRDSVYLGNIGTSIGTTPTISEIHSSYRQQTRVASARRLACLARSIRTAYHSRSAKFDPIST